MQIKSASSFALNILVSHRQWIVLRMLSDVLATVRCARVQTDGSNKNIDCVHSTTISACGCSQNPSVGQNRTTAELSVCQRSQGSHVRNLAQVDVGTAGDETGNGGIDNDGCGERIIIKTVGIFIPSVSHHSLTKVPRGKRVRKFPLTSSS
jgi:hypothetical protein